jgi:hypothetical protein
LSLVLLIAELISATVAILLAFLSLSCKKTLKDRGIQKSLWTPVFFSSYLFLVSSLLAILYTFSVDIMAEVKLLEIFFHTLWLAGLGILAYGVYSYLQMIERS